LEEVEENDHGLTDICLERMSKTMLNFSQDSQYPGRGSNRAQARNVTTADLRETECEYVNWIKLAHHWFQCQFF
jgi:hypothetical protein